MANKAFMDQLKVAVEVMEIFLVSYVGSIVQRNSFEINVTFAFSYSRLIPLKISLKISSVNVTQMRRKL